MPDTATTETSTEAPETTESTETTEPQETTEQGTTSTETAPQEGEDGKETEPKVFDEDYVKGLRRESASYRTRASNAETELATARTDLQTAQGEKEAAEARATTAEADVLRYQVALEKGLSASLAKRLVGSSREELEADADSLSEAVGTRRTPADLGQGSGRGPVPAPKAGVNDALRALAFGK